MRMLCYTSSKRRREEGLIHINAMVLTGIKKNMESIRANEEAASLSMHA